MVWLEHYVANPTFFFKIPEDFTGNKTLIAQIGVILPEKAMFVFGSCERSDENIDLITKGIDQLERGILLEFVVLVCSNNSRGKHTDKFGVLNLAVKVGEVGCRDFLLSGDIVSAAREGVKS